MNSHRMTLRRWAAWAPGLGTWEQWQNWSRSAEPLAVDGSPNSTSIPSMLRRRCSRVTRAALAVADACLSDEEKRSVRTIFASRHGEAEVTEKLLEALARDELLSPMHFGLSVHNAGSGLFSIINKNKATSTAIAARGQTLFAALIEALCLISEFPEDPVAVIVSDEPLPEVFRTNKDEQVSYVAAAFVFSANAAEGLALTLSSSQAFSEGKVMRGLPDFLRWLCSDDAAAQIENRSDFWTVSKNGSARAHFLPPDAM